MFIIEQRGPFVISLRLFAYGAMFVIWCGNSLKLLIC